METVMQRLVDKASATVEAAKRAGADAVDAIVIRTHSRAVNVRFGKIEETDALENDGFSLRVFVGKRIASISANQMDNPESLADRAVSMAKVTPENPFDGLVDAQYRANTISLKESLAELDLFDSFSPTNEQLADDASNIESAALSVLGVSNSEGASSSFVVSGFVLVTSDGFCESYATSYFGRSCSVIAGDGTKMERDYAYSSALHFSDMESCKTIGERAGKLAISRLGSRQIKTGLVNVIFHPRVARGIAGHLAGMLNGALVARKTSLLCQYMGKRIMKTGICVRDNPLYRRGLASRPFDGEGVIGENLDVIQNGVLCHWLLSSASARELGLVTNGRAMRSASAITPECSNFTIESGSISPDEMIRDIDKGFYVTELFGHGVDLMTGQYSRGAAGFWIENGQISFPVSEVTLGSDLLHMLAHLTPANDLNRRYDAISSPTLCIEGMMLAGK